MIARALLVTFILLTQSTASFAGRSTYPVPQKRTPNDPLKIHPGMDVPQNPEKFVWKAKNGARVAAFDELGRGTIVGSLPKDAEVEIKGFRQVNGSIFYAFPFKRSDGTAITGYVNGSFLSAVSLRQ